MYRKSGIGYVLVITSATHKVNTGRKGIDGKEIVVDVAFNPIEHVLNYAEVFQLPVGMDQIPIYQKHLGSPGYGPIRRPPLCEHSGSPDIYAIGGVYQYKFKDDIAQEVKVGDRIYFKKRTLNKPENALGQLKGPDGKTEKFIFKCPYENIYCAVREGKIIPIGSHVLLEPVYEDWADIYRKTYYDQVDHNGDRIERPQDQWIKLKVAPEASNLRGVIARVGTPLRGEPCDFKVGETVIFKQQTPLVYQRIEGKDYIVLTQDKILASLTQNIKVA